MRRRRDIIRLQHSCCADAIDRHFPKQVKMASPSGGQSIWIVLPRGIKGRDVYTEAKKARISILPGYLYTRFDAFDRHIRIGYGGTWGKNMEGAIRTIGSINKGLMTR